ncbi:hypothetical protein [Cognatishimia sp. F0-27]|uniref:hypothetical protein n=1 Tax=Cognatishimia sp. F0-27 TaxID=2816855 RepID=UPI001D0C62EE|nr:hypothetical protein [Cognatishimia sp. F0-27]MCC1495123.1 hypothetical protein [Cognatishimia sp. F0-27]
MREVTSKSIIDIIAGSEELARKAKAKHTAQLLRMAFYTAQAEIDYDAKEHDFFIAKTGI